MLEHDRARQQPPAWCSALNTRRRFVLGLVVFVLLSLLPWWLSRGAEPAEGGGARVVVPAPVAPPAKRRIETVRPTAEPPQWLTVTLGPQERLPLARRVQALPIAFIETAVDDSVAGRALERWLDEGANTRAGADLVQAARADGLPDLSTPERATLSLLAAWIEADTSYEQSFAEFKSTHLPAGTSWEQAWSTLADHPEMPAHDVDGLLALSEQVMAMYPDHGAYDMAQVARVRVAAAYGFEDRDGAMAAASLTLIEDPDAARLAAHLLVGVPVWTHHDRLDAALAQVDLGVRERHEAAIWALRLAWQAEDMTAAARHLKLAEQTEEQLGAVEGIDEDRTWRLQQVGGRLAAAGTRAPASWEEALIAALWTCPGAQAGTVELWWRDGWSSAADGATATCLVGAGAPYPDEPVVVFVTVVMSEP